jgi:hypothetical protein
MKIYVVFIASLGNFDGILLLYINKIKIKLSLLLEYIILRQIKLLSHLKSFICNCGAFPVAAFLGLQCSLHV